MYQTRPLGLISAFYPKAADTTTDSEEADTSFNSTATHCAGAKVALSSTFARPPSLDLRGHRRHLGAGRAGEPSSTRGRPTARPGGSPRTHTNAPPASPSDFKRPVARSARTRRSQSKPDRGPSGAKPIARARSAGRRAGIVEVSWTPVLDQRSAAPRPARSIAL